MSVKESSLFDDKRFGFSDKCFVISLAEEGVETYACINRDMAFNDMELQPTGGYHVYYLHPKQGSTKFYINIYGSEWESEDMPGYIESDIIEKIVFAIHSKRASTPEK